MVGRRVRLVQGAGTGALAAVRVVPLGVHDPLAPADPTEVHPHVHLPAQLAGLLLHSWSWSGGRGVGHSLVHLTSVLLLVVVMVVLGLVPLGSVARPTAVGASLPLQAHVLGLLGCVDQRVPSPAPGAGALLGEHHQHHLVGGRVLHTPLHLLAPLLLLLLLLLCIPLLLPADEQLRHVEHLPGGGGGHGGGAGPKTAQEHGGAAPPQGGVVEGHGGPGGLGEGGQAEAQLRALDVLAVGDGGQVEGHRPSLSSLLAS